MPAVDADGQQANATRMCRRMPRTLKGKNEADQETGEVCAVGRGRIRIAGPSQRGGRLGSTPR